MDPPNGREALDEIALDVAEGADMVMVKPALAYLDVDRRAARRVRRAGRRVPRERRVRDGQGRRANGWIDGDAVALEHLTSIKRAGADFVLTYFARELAERLGVSSGRINERRCSSARGA